MGYHLSKNKRAIASTTLPSGATLISRKNSDGSLAEESGSGQQNLLYSTSIVLSLPCSVTSLKDGSLLSQQLNNGFGEPISSISPTTEEGITIATSSQY